jgi:hypothetical protein
LFGLSADNNPNTILRMLGSHWWRRRTEESGYALDDGEYKAYISLPFSSNINTLCNVFYSDSVTVTENGITLDNPKEYTWSTTDIEGGKTYELDVLKGKYFRHGSESEPLSYIFKGADDSIQGTKDSGNSLRITNITLYRPKYYTTNGEWEYIYSENKDEYPEGTDGMFYYEYLGVPFENAIDAKKNTEDILNTLSGGVS